MARRDSAAGALSLPLARRMKDKESWNGAFGQTRSLSVRVECKGVRSTFDGIGSPSKGDRPSRRDAPRNTGSQFIDGYFDRLQRSALITATTAMWGLVIN